MSGPMSTAPNASEQSEADTQVQEPRLQGGRTSGRLRSRLMFGWIWLRKIAFSRWLLVICGAGALAVGLFGAFRSGASTTPVIAGAVLLVLALLIGPDWQEIEARYKDAGLRFIRGVEDRVHEAKESDTEAELREQVAQLEQDLKRAREATERGDVLDPSPATRQRIYTATHTPADGKVLLTLEIPSSSIPGESFRCVVRDPNLKTASKTVSVPFAVIPGRREVTMIYPDDFADAGPLTPGTYVVEWHRRNPLTFLNTLSGDPVVARDGFTIPG
jgi:hypothetical protein